MKIVILNKADLSVASRYEADAPKQHEYGGPWGNPDVTIHVAVPEEMDARALEFALAEDGSVEITENVALKATLQQQDTVMAVRAAVAKAMAFGQQLITEFAAENVMLGITQDGQTGTVLTKMAPVMTALQSGSLYEAIARAQAIPQSQFDSKYVTHARLMAFINKIEAYLGLPLSL